MASNSSSSKTNNKRAMGRALSALSFLYGAGELDENKYTKILHLLGRNEDFMCIKDNNSDIPSSISSSPDHAIVPIKLVGDTVSRGNVPKIRRDMKQDLYATKIPKKGGRGLSQDDVFGVSVNSSSPEDSSSQSLLLKTASDNSSSGLTSTNVNRLTLRTMENIDGTKPYPTSTPRPSTCGREPNHLSEKTLENATPSTLRSPLSASSSTPIKVSDEIMRSTIDRKPAIRKVCNTLHSVPATAKTIYTQPTKIQTPPRSSCANVHPLTSGGIIIVDKEYRSRKSSGLRFSQHVEGHESPLNGRGALEPTPTRPAKWTGNKSIWNSDVPNLIDISGGKEDEGDGDESDGGGHLCFENGGTNQTATGRHAMKNTEGADAIDYGTWVADYKSENAMPKALARSGRNGVGTDLNPNITLPPRPLTPTPAHGIPHRPDDHNSSHRQTDMTRSNPFHRPQLPRPTSSEARIIVCPWWSTYGSCSMRGCPFQHRNLEVGIYQRLICPYWLGLHPTIPKCKHDAETCRFAHIEAKHAQWAPFPNWAKF